MELIERNRILNCEIFCPEIISIDNTIVVAKSIFRSNLEQIKTATIAVLNFKCLLSFDEMIIVVVR